ncbi:MAG: aminopeptidase P family protein [Deltaproteobacteria bacterium]|nr:aminopeptidase P family protein [Deltaproteobacteria bacterium]
MEIENNPSPLFVPSSEIESRLSRFQDLMIQEGLDGVLLCQNVDLLYFSGTMQPGYLYLPVQEEPFLLVKKNLERAMEESSLTNIVSLSSSKEIPSLLAERDISAPQILGLEMDVLPAGNFLQLKSIFKKCRILDASILIRKCRMYKSPWEIENITRAARMLQRMVLEIPRILRPGMTEIELAGKLEAFLRQEGHQGYIRSRGFNQELFFGHILSGPEGSKPSYLDSPSGGSGVGPAFSQGAGTKLLKPHEAISVDFVGCYNGYLADQTRMFSLGEPPSAVKEAFRAVQTIQQSLLEKTHPGIPCDQVYFWALEEADRLGYLTRFMGMGPSLVRYIGHGLGLELDELPVIGQKFDWPLETGMVFALEPKMVLLEQGLVGIENTYQMTEQGLIPITTAPEDFQVL